MEQGLNLLVLLLFGSVCVVAMFVVLSFLFAKVVGETRRMAQQSPGRALLIGLVNFLFFGSIAMAIGSYAESVGVRALGLLSVVLVVALTVGVIFGLAGMVELLSLQLFPETHGWRRTAGGATALTLACITPFVGWFGLLPYVGLRGLGAFILSLAERWRTRQRPSSEGSEA